MCGCEYNRWKCRWWECQYSNTTQDGIISLLTDHQHLIRKFPDPLVNRQVSYLTRVCLFLMTPRGDLVLFTLYGTRPATCGIVSLIAATQVCFFTDLNAEVCAWHHWRNEVRITVLWKGGEWLFWRNGSSGSQPFEIGNPAPIHDHNRYSNVTFRCASMMLCFYVFYV